MCTWNLCNFFLVPLFQFWYQIELYICCIIIQIQAVLQSLVLRGESHKSLKPMLNILYRPTTSRKAHLVVSKISTYLCQLRPKLICSDQIWKTQWHASMVKPQLPVFSKSSNSQDHLFWVWHQAPTQFTPTAIQCHFLSEGLLWQMMTVISFLHGCKSAPSDYGTWTKRDWVVQSLTKLNNKI